MPSSPIEIDLETFEAIRSTIELLEKNEIHLNADTALKITEQLQYGLFLTARRFRICYRQSPHRGHRE